MNQEREWAIVLDDDHQQMSMGEILERYRARGDWRVDVEEEKFLNKHFLFLGILSGLAAGSLGLAVLALT